MRYIGNDKWEYKAGDGAIVMLSENDVFNFNYQLRKRKKILSDTKRPIYAARTSPADKKSNKVTFDVGQLIHNLKLEYLKQKGILIKEDFRIADLLDIKTQHLSRCKRIKTAPLKEIIHFCKKEGLSLDAIFCTF
jgi:hypothetical protein